MPTLTSGRLWAMRSLRHSHMTADTKHSPITNAKVTFLTQIIHGWCVRLAKTAHEVVLVESCENVCGS